MSSAAPSWTRWVRPAATTAGTAIQMDSQANTPIDDAGIAGLPRVDAANISSIPCAANRRSDDLYHAYNILHLGEGKAAVGHLYEMLEGQVAILSSGLLSGDRVSGVAGKPAQQSTLPRRPAQLHPVPGPRSCQGSSRRIRVKPGQVNGLGLVAELVKANDKSLIAEGRRRQLSLRTADFRNVKDVARAATSWPLRSMRISVKQDAAEDQRPVRGGLPPR
ncbi:MAG: hypothetical protein M0C28_34495 [Candidatus Moduliflexus flocculans]|nr:hypothetical protein [Candidatus Moduliflexus flocculans]